MQDLNFNTGMMELAIQGDTSKILRFNPSDGNLISGFLGLINEANGKLKELSIAEDDLQGRRSGMDDLEYVKQKNRLDLETDEFFRAELDGIFGDGIADMVFGKVCTTAVTEGGECVFMNFIYALLPFFTSEIQSRNKKIQQIIQDHKPPKR